MLQEVFYWVFNMSITASLAGLIIMLIRLIKKIPRRITVFLWIIPFIRMALPFGLNSPYSFISLLSRVTTKIATKTIVVYQPVEDLSFSFTNIMQAAETYSPITYKVNILENVFSVASIVWIIGFLAIFLILAIAYFSTIHGVKDATRLEGNVYLLGNITSPAVYGIVKPKIILPTSYKDGDNELVLLHEKTHIRRLDNLWRIVAFVIVSMHWFNPLCWLFLKEFLADIELSCDERVLIKSGANRAKEYAMSLLESRRGGTMFASAFGGSKIRTRIDNILSFKKLTWLSVAAFVALLGVIFYMLLTNAG